MAVRTDRCGAETPPVVGITAEFIVRFQPEVSRTEIDRLNTGRQVTIVREDPFVPNQFVLRPDDSDPRRARDLSGEYSLLEEVA